jgi:gliding motility-associated-like protein
VFVKDANGCTNDSAIDVIEPDSSAQIFLISSTKNSCIGVYDATLTVSAKNGFRPYNYFLNGISQLKDSMFDGLIPGDFVVEVIDSIGCRSTGKYFIDSSTRKPNIILTDIKNNICKYDIIGQSAWTYNNVYYPVTAIVNQDTIFSDTSIQYLNNGNYVLHIVDDKGCKADTSFTISYTNSMEIAVTATDASCSGAGDDGKVSVEAKNGTSPYTYNWSLPQPSNLSAIDKIGYGTYSIVVVDNEGCIDSANFIIAYYPCCTIWMPNVFSPNHDGLNDNVILKPSGPVSFENLSIYNRWGIKVFETNNYNTLWDGKYLEQDCDMDTYFFIMRYTCPLSKRTLIKKGDITLIR